MKMVFGIFLSILVLCFLLVQSGSAFSQSHMSAPHPIEVPVSDESQEGESEEILEDALCENILEWEFFRVKSKANLFISSISEVFRPCLERPPIG